MPNTFIFKPGRVLCSVYGCTDTSPSRDYLLLTQAAFDATLKLGVLDHPGLYLPLFEESLVEYAVEISSFPSQAKNCFAFFFLIASNTLPYANIWI